MSKKVNNDGILDVINAMRALEDFVLSKNGTTINLGTVETFTQGSYLHQNTEEMTEEESAKEERDNPELFRFLQSFDRDIDNVVNRFLKG